MRDRLPTIAAYVTSALLALAGLGSLITLTLIGVLLGLGLLGVAMLLTQTTRLHASSTAQVELLELLLQKQQRPAFKPPIQPE